MRVLYFSQDYTPHDYRFLSKLVGSPHTIYWMRLENRAGKEKRYIPNSINQIRWEYGEGPLNSTYENVRGSFIKNLDWIKPDLIHAWPLDSCAYIATSRDKIPVLSMCGTHELFGSGRLASISAIKYSSGIACDSGFVRSEISKFTEKPVWKFAWGIDLKQFPFNPRTKTYRYIILGTKGHVTIYNAFTRAVKKNPNIRLVLLGEESSTCMIRDWIKKDGMSNFVYAPGTVPETMIRRYLGASNMYVTASTMDGASIMLLQAMAVGCTIAASAIPGNMEWVKDDTAFLFPPRDEERLSDYMGLSMYLDPVRQAERARINRKFVEEWGNWDENFDVLMKAYKETGRK